MNKRIKILIVEDEVLIAEFIREMLNKEGYESVGVVYDLQSAVHYIEKNEPEILLLDINIGVKDGGIELAKKRNPKVSVIYITAQNDEGTMLKAIETSPVNYLTKPIRKIEVLASIKLAIKNLKNESIVVKDSYKEIKIFYYDLLFVKSDGNYIEIHTTTKKHVIRQSLDTFLNELNSPLFCKSHRSYIVNKEKVTMKTSTSVFLDTIEIPLSRSYSLNF